MTHAALVILALLVSACYPLVGRPRVTPTATCQGDPNRLLSSSDTLCIVTSNAAMGAEMGRRLLGWGRLSLVDRPESADLVLVVDRIDPLVTQSEFRESFGRGLAFTARVTHRATAATIWWTTKGGTWPLSYSDGAWAGRAIADELIARIGDASRRVSRK